MIRQKKLDKLQRIKQRSALYRRQNPNFAQWAAGYGVIKHSDLTQVRVYKMADHLSLQGLSRDKDKILNYLHAADRVASAALWLVAHMTYAKNVYLDGRDLDATDSKTDPEGHTGGALNMVLAYVGYVTLNAITGHTRSWLMGQGHCVAAIDATNLLMGNMTKAHADRYNFSEEGLTRFARDFYSQKVRPDGYPESPVGSHVNAHTAGGLVEGGYLGFAELFYVHMPLPGERLVAFLSDGAFEEQKGGDWAPRWWRAEDCGLVAPIMIANGRRIDQRTTVSMQGGVDWFRNYLELNGFEPFDIDGKDPAAYAWAIWEMEERLSAHGEAVKSGQGQYPVSLPYTIAEVPKGFGLPNAGTNAAHNLPLGGDLINDASARQAFNSGVRQTWVPPEELKAAIEMLTNHDVKHRPLERDHALATRCVSPPNIPELDWHDPNDKKLTSPMRAVDSAFCEIVKENPGLRPRVGNPDEIRSNRLEKTLELLQHRVTDPEENAPEATDGKIITALNEEAIVSAALGNKGGINLVATYEAFAVKMLGAVRQEIIFARHLAEAGHPPGWLSIPVIATSHTWENGKNEISHQDPTFCEALMSEMSDVSRVLFPVDWNTAMAALEAVYRSHGQIWAMVIAKRLIPEMFTAEQAKRLIEDGAVYLQKQDKTELLIIAIGSYQLLEAKKAAERLTAKGLANSVICMVEPGRFRQARDSRESACLAPEDVKHELFPTSTKARVFVSHARPESITGVLRPFDTGPTSTRTLGYLNRGGTFDAFGMLFSNQCTWAHIVAEAASAIERKPDDFLSRDEIRVINGQGEPEVLQSSFAGLG
jgi:phosphoketolase